MELRPLAFARERKMNAAALAQDMECTVAHTAIISPWKGFPSFETLEDVFSHFRPVLHRQRRPYLASAGL